MPGREEGYYGPSDSDVGCGAVMLAILMAAGVVMVAVLSFFSLHDALGVSCVCGYVCGCEEVEADEA